MRDLRRYNLPVMINNLKQVNIAAEGRQQVNVQKQRGKRRINRKIEPVKCARKGELKTYPCA